MRRIKREARKPNTWREIKPKHSIRIGFIIPDVDGSRTETFSWADSATEACIQIQRTLGGFPGTRCKVTCRGVAMEPGELIMLAAIETWAGGA